MTQWVNRREGTWRLALTIVLAALPLWAVANDAISAKAGTSLGIVIATREARPGKDVSVPVTLQTNGLRPATLTMSIRFDPTYLSYVKEADGPAAIAADKAVTALEIPRGSLNIVVAGFNSYAMSDGVLFTAVFHVAELAPQGILPLECPASSLSASPPEIASLDVSASDGAIEVICSGPPVPNPVAGSLVAAQGALVIWGESSGASAYQVYRGETDDVALAVAVSDWLPATTNQYMDSSFLANIQDYCRLYFWVRARNADECASDPGGPVDFALKEIPAAPTGLTATHGNSDGILLTWNATLNATDYRVYRSNSSDPATRQPLTGWLSATYSYIDATAAAAQNDFAIGCSGRQVLDVVKYTYWVTARNANGCESDASALAQGSRGLSGSAAASVLPSEVGDALLWLAAGAFLALCRLSQKARRACSRL